MRIFGAIFSLSQAAGSARRRLKKTATYNAKLAVEFAWEHEPSSLSHYAMASLSLLIYSSELGVDFAKLPFGDDGQHARCTCPIEDEVLVMTSRIPNLSDLSSYRGVPTGSLPIRVVIIVGVNISM